MRLLFYSDVDVFGGHEVTVLDAIEGAARVPNVVLGVAYSKFNRRFAKQLEKRLATCPGIERLPHDFTNIRGDLLRAFAPSPKRRAIKKFIGSWKPDIIIVCQGHIGVSICALAAAVDLPAKVISFIPNAHTWREIKWEEQGSLLIWAVDALLANAYRWPSRFLTIDASVANRLTCIHGLDSHCIHVIEYGPDLDRLKPISRAAARANLQLGDDCYIGIVGRIDYKAKGYDIILNAIARRGGLPGNARLLIVGDGPDAEFIKSRIKKSGWESLVKFLPWCDDVSSVYSALDLLLLPSRSEGAPIVVMEAMYFRLPVIASDIDGIRALLPDEWRFPVGSGDHMMTALDRVFRGVDPDLLERHRRYIITTRNAARFREGIADYLEGLSALHQA